MEEETEKSRGSVWFKETEVSRHSKTDVYISSQKCYSMNKTCTSSNQIKTSASLRSHGIESYINREIFIDNWYEILKKIQFSSWSDERYIKHSPQQIHAHQKLTNNNLTHFISWLHFLFHFLFNFFFISFLLPPFLFFLSFEKK